MTTLDDAVAATRPQLVIFDLDGTLTDSAQGIVSSFRHALDEVGALQREGLDGLVYMGLGWAGREVAKARTELKWDVPRVMNNARPREPGR